MIIMVGDESWDVAASTASGQTANEITSNIMSNPAVEEVINSGRGATDNVSREESERGKSQKNRNNRVDMLLLTAEEDSLRKNGVKISREKVLEGIKNLFADASKALISGNAKLALNVYQEAYDKLAKHPTIVLEDFYDYIWFKYGHFISMVDADSFSSLVKAYKSQDELRTALHAEMPTYHYAIAKLLIKCNRYRLAEDEIKMSRNLMIGHLFQKHFWPGTRELIKEASPDGLDKCLQELTSICKYYRAPDATCKYEGCLNASSHPYPSREIFLSDADFKGYVVLTCQEGCRIQYHPSCWKNVKDTFTNLDKLCDKDCLGKPCLTPDCRSISREPSVIIKIEIFGSDGKLKSQCAQDQLAEIKQKEVSLKKRQRRVSEEIKTDKQANKNKQKPRKAPERSQSNECLPGSTKNQPQRDGKPLQICGVTPAKKTGPVKKTVPKEANSSSGQNDFICSYFMMLVNRLGTLSRERVVQEWEKLYPLIKPMGGIEDKSSSDIFSLLRKSSSFVLVDGLLCIRESLEMEAQKEPENVQGGQTPLTTGLREMCAPQEVVVPPEMTNPVELEEEPREEEKPPEVKESKKEDGSKEDEKPEDPQVNTIPPVNQENANDSDSDMEIPGLEPAPQSSSKEPDVTEIRKMLVPMNSMIDFEFIDFERDSNSTAPSEPESNGEPDISEPEKTQTKDPQNTDRNRLYNGVSLHMINPPTSPVAVNPGRRRNHLVIIDPMTGAPIVPNNIPNKENPPVNQNVITQAPLEWPNGRLHVRKHVPPVNANGMNAYMEMMALTPQLVIPQYPYRPQGVQASEYRDACIQTEENWENKAPADDETWVQHMQMVVTDLLKKNKDLVTKHQSEIEALRNQVQTIHNSYEEHIRSLKETQGRSVEEERRRMIVMEQRIKLQEGILKSTTGELRSKEFDLLEVKRSLGIILLERTEKECSRQVKRLVTALASLPCNSSDASAVGKAMSLWETAAERASQVKSEFLNACIMHQTKLMDGFGHDTLDDLMVPTIQLPTGSCPLDNILMNLLHEKENMTTNRAKLPIGAELSQLKSRPCTPASTSAAMASSSGAFISPSLTSLGARPRDPAPRESTLRNWPSLASVHSTHSSSSGNAWALSNFDKLLMELKRCYPSRSESELYTAIKAARRKNKNTLSGLPIKRIVTMVGSALEWWPEPVDGSMGLDKFMGWASDVTSVDETFCSVMNESKLGGAACSGKSFEKDDCSICLQRLAEPKTILVCLHAFHTDCIRKWLKKESNCPLCRKSARMEDEYPALK